MLELMKAIRSMLKACKAVEAETQVLVIADSDGASMWMGQLVMNVVNSMGAEAVLTIITPPEITGDEPPPSVAAAMKSVNTIFRITDNVGLVHTTARKEATAAGARFYSIHPAQADDIKRGVLASDIRLISERTRSLTRRLTQANSARVTNPSGTNITMTLTGRKAVALEPLSQGVAGLPDYGEAAISPVEGTAEGIIVADLAIVQWKYLLREPLRLTVKAGKVVDISGSVQDADRLRQITARDENAINIAELGIGTSHIIPLPMHGIRRDAARIGTAHIGIGRNDDIGGATWSRIHVDALMDMATVELDGQCVVTGGALLI